MNFLNDNIVSSFASQSRNTPFGFSTAKPISILVLSMLDRQFHLTKAVKDYLSSLEGPCYLISVSGNPLVGKSSLLNLLMSFCSFFNTDIFLNLDGRIPYQDIYTIGDGKRSTTEGVDMYCVKVMDTNYIFLDVEGDNDPNRKETGVWIYSNLISLAVGASHVHIYNFNGIPHESFLTYFDSINKLVNQNQVHPEIKTKHIFLKRNHALDSLDELPGELKDFKQNFEDRLIQGGLDYSVYMVPSAPKHLIKIRFKDSCIFTEGMICTDCRNDLFTSIILDMFHEINDILHKAPSFESGQKVLSVFEQLVVINTKELPYFLDEGHICKIRSNKFRKEQLRVQRGLQDTAKFFPQKNLSKQIQQIVHDHPNLAEVDLFQNFETLSTRVMLKVSQLEYLIPEISKFVEEYLMDDRFSIMDASEKLNLTQTYTDHLRQITGDILIILKEYEKLVGEIITNLQVIKEDIKTNLKEFANAHFDAKARSTAVATNFVTSSIIGFLAREAAAKVVVGCLVGGGALAAVFTVVTFIQAKRKWDQVKKKNEESLNTKKIPGINNAQEAEEQMKKVDEFISQLVDNLKKSNAILNEVCSHEEISNNSQLIRKIDQVIDKKINGQDVNNDDKAQLVEFMIVTQSNLEKFKKSI